MVRSFSQLALTCSSPFEFSVRSNDLWKTSVVTMATMIVLEWIPYFSFGGQGVHQWQLVLCRTLHRPLHLHVQQTRGALYTPTISNSPHMGTIPLPPLLPPSVSSFSPFWSFSSPVSAVQPPISLGTAPAESLRSERGGDMVSSFMYDSTTMRNLSYQAAEEFSRGVCSHLHCPLSPLPPQHPLQGTLHWTLYIKHRHSSITIATSLPWQHHNSNTTIIAVWTR